MISKPRLEQLYIKEGKSLQGVADVLGCSTNRVHYWLKRHAIPARSRSAAVYLKHNPEGDPFSLKKHLTKEDLLLMGLGLGLWWGEGNKRNAKVIRLGNTDPELIKTFIKFLSTICGVPKRKIRFGLQVFSDTDPLLAKKYWARFLHAQMSQFLPKVVVTPSRGKGSYRHKLKNGVLTVYCANVKLRKVMDILLETYAKSLIH